VPHFLGTNILLYSISRNPADALKRERAIALPRRDHQLYSEDMSHGQEVDGVIIVNPFR
jgi:predicted nucleic acid-binding protein